MWRGGGGGVAVEDILYIPTCVHFFKSVDVPMQANVSEHQTLSSGS